MKIVEALRKVYAAMGGTDTFSETDIANGIEQISEVAGGGGSSTGTPIKIVPYHIGDAVTPMVGGFVKEMSEQGVVYYTVSEMNDMFTQYQGRLFTVNTMNPEVITAIRRSSTVGSGVYYTADVSYIYLPSEPSETEAYGTHDYVYVSENLGNSVNRTSWTWSVTNDD